MCYSISALNTDLQGWRNFTYYLVHLQEFFLSNKSKTMPLCSSITVLLIKS